MKQKIKKHLIAVLLISGVSWVVYFNCLKNDFVFDDIQLVVENYEIRSLKNIPAILGFDDGWPNYRPIRTLSYFIDYFISGLNPISYHISNVAYHILGTIFLYLIVVQIAKNHRMAIFAGILFAIHPIHTDAVTYISGRRDVLSSLFYLMGFWLFLRYRNTNYKRYMAFACVAYVLGAFTKEMAVTLPLIFLAYDFCFDIDKGIKVLKKYKYQHLIFFVIVGMFAYYSIVVYSPAIIKAMKADILGYFLENVCLNLLTVLRIWCFYIKLLFFPMTLNADYSFNAFPRSTSVFEIQTLFCLIFLSGVGYLIFRFRHKKIVAFSALWFFITILPVSGVIPHHEMVTEHYLYLPSAGFCILIAWLFEQLVSSPRLRSLAYPIILIFLILLSVRTIVRNKDWKDQFTLWEKTAKTQPNCARAHNNFGGCLQEKGRINEALGEFKRALEISPNYYLAQHNIAFCYYLKDGWSKKVEQEFEKCFREHPNYELAHFNLGCIYQREGLIEKAESEYEKTLRINPKFIYSLKNLGSIYLQKGQINKALTLYKEVVKINPDCIDSHMILEMLYRKMKMKDKAAEEYKTLLKLSKK
ncbi:MAG: tetratricopeptide repeat protein [Deltaproteobacteria bacterium]|uniref:Tetratricopeptide repeat protein n=1 Tax=Candidatus Desulfacyla euxinica TaxID=2841693 RepID=A0A8J6T3L0_9DELT|nr:tetratricopeptide repeat protein [Candidatus Desulfacyla euxinica]